MKLSVIIVNYNVRAYLEQCLRTVGTALSGIEGEIFVVDNQSTDGSVEMVRRKFPQVQLIANTENVGFSRANNQAIRSARGEYVLLLNPDTVVGEDVFHKVIAFMDAHPRTGGLGVKMIDGRGRFLPESKRGLPTPQVAFFKIIGLTRLFPRSRLFGRYHLGHLPENEAAPIEILSGACMFLRKKTLDEVGLLDESFFMYGEDIDLSYRITLGGYENWYFPDARIIHYKGESTKKSSVNYVFVFYEAMAIFARKHFSGGGGGIFPLLINASIYLSAAAAIAVRFLSRALLPMLDAFAMVVLISLFAPLSGPLWGLLPSHFTALFILFVMAGSAAVGGYDLPVRWANVVKTTGLTVVFLAMGQALSSATPGYLVLTVSLLGIQLGGQMLVRLLLHLARIKPYVSRTLDRQRVLAIGDPRETKLALALLWQTHFGLGRQEQVAAEVAERSDAHKFLRRAIRSSGIDEVVFCARDLQWGRIIELMERLERTGAEFKIAQSESNFIIGPNSIESLQDLYILDDHALNGPAALRSKRIVDVVIAALLLVASPILAPFMRNPRTFLRNTWQVLRGERSWVGYDPMVPKPPRLPKIPPGILSNSIGLASPPDPLTAKRMNILYAKDYSPIQDLRLLIGHLGIIGRDRRSG